MVNNPFVLTFGRQPIQYIARPVYFEEVKESFLSDTRPNQVYMITGVRGSGKTVLLSSLAQSFEQRNDWIVVDLNPERDMLFSFASQIYNSSKVKHLFVKANINFSFNGIGINVGKENVPNDIETSINKMVEYLDGKGKKILVTIDDAVSNVNIKTFAHTFQSLIRKNYSIFMLMTGLYENITTIQNNKSLTFLARAPKLMLSPLNLPAIKESYKALFNLDEEEAIKMANLTSGYAFAYQVLGYLLWNRPKKEIDDSLLVDYDQFLAEFVYDKLWEKLPDMEKKVLEVICESTEVDDILKNLNISSSDLSTYRKRLINRGLVQSKKRGELSFVLPRFKEYIENITNF